MQQELIELRKKLNDTTKRSNQFEEELEKFKRTKYEEVPKTGSNYTIQTDCIGVYKNGFTERELKKRVKEHQTSNAEQIVILHDFRTSEPRLLEKIVHRSLPNGNGEFFRCDLQHMKNVVDILGHTIDTVKSSSQMMTKEEIMSKIHEKLQIGTETEKTTQKEVEVIEEISDEKKFLNWLHCNVEFNRNSILCLGKVCENFVGVKVPSRALHKYRVKIENFLKENFPVLDIKTPNFHKIQKTSFQKQKYNGWLNFRLK
jgi:hypothetical protein